MRKFRDAILQLEGYKAPETRKGICLDLNESRWGCSSKVLDFLRKISAEEIGKYPDERKLVKLLADYYRVDEECIMLTNGADEGIRCVMDACIERGDEVVMVDPTFSIFEIVCKICSAEIKKVPYRKNLEYPVDEVINSIGEKTKIVVVVNPDSPTGSWINRKEFIRILEGARDSFVLLDETYHHFAGETFVDLVRNYSNLIVIHSFSKAFGLAGLRLGYLVSQPENIKEIKKARLPFSVSSMAVAAGCEAMKDIDYIKYVVKEVNVEKEFLHRKLDEIGVEMKKTYTNFVLIDVGKKSKDVCKHLMENGILVKSLHEVPLLSKYIRVAVGKREDNEMLIDALRKVLPPQAIIFDVDDVLIDVSRSYIMCIKKTAEYFLEDNVEIDEIKEYKLKGYNNDWELTHALLESRKVSVSINRISEKFQELYSGKDWDGLVRNEKCLIKKKVLRKLAAKYHLAVVTSRPKNEAEHAFQRFGLKEFFDVLIAMEDMGEKQKPDPYGIRIAMEKMKVKRAIYVGDNVEDMRSANAAGVTAIGVVRGKNRERIKNVLRNAGAQYIIGDVNKILEVVE